MTGAKSLVLSLVNTAGAGQAVLFYGMDGSGKTQLARILAKAYLCTKPTSDGACGECQSCGAFERGRNADLLNIYPAPPSRITRLAAIYPVKNPQPPDIEFYPLSAQTFLRTPPLASKSKVVIIHDADRMNNDAANAVLKTLEEPPDFVRFILTTEAVGSIIPTVLSRCIAVACEVPEKLDGGPAWASALSGNAPGRTRQLNDSEAAYRPICDFAASLPARPKAEALIVSEQFAALSDNLQEALKLSARSANAEALDVLATAYANLPEHDPKGLPLIIEAHRRILGNASEATTLDALFAALLG